MCEVPAITDADIQYLTSLDEEIVGTILDYSNLPVLNPITDEHRKVLDEVHEKIDQYSEQFSKIPDARLIIEVSLKSEQYPQHGVELGGALWSTRADKNSGRAILFTKKTIIETDHKADVTITETGSF